VPQTELRDFNERNNLAASRPEIVQRLSAKLRAWHATIPHCDRYVSTPSCERFSSAVFPAAVVAPTPPQVWEDSEPDFWFDASTGQHVSY
jgi:hypothetical protein